MKKRFKLLAVLLIVLLSGCSLCLAMGVLGAIGGLAYAVGDSYSPVVFVADAYGAVVVKAKTDGIKAGDVVFTNATSQKEVTDSDPLGKYNGTLKFETTDGGATYTVNGTLKLDNITPDLEKAFPTIKNLPKPIDIIFENIVMIGDEKNRFYTGLTSGWIYVGGKATNWKVDMSKTGKAVGFFKEADQNINGVIEETFGGK